MPVITPRVELLGSSYSVLQRNEVHSYLEQCAQAGQPGYVCVSNVHTTMMGFFDPSYQQITNHSLLSVPDGVPLVWGMRSMGAKEQDRVRGPSLMRDLIDRGRGWGAKHYLYGGSLRAIEDLKKVLQERYPGVQIVGAESPPFRPLEEIDDWAEVAARINSSGAHFVWIGLGAPKQERWMWRQKDAVKGVMLGVGAAFDLIPGVVPEAPEFLQRLGLEWAYRFAMEPRRLWRRYLFNNPAFLLLWGAQLLRAKVLRKNFLSDGRKNA